MDSVEISRIISLWTAGGWLMIPLACVAIFTYGAAVQLLAYFSKREFKSVSEKQWKSWVLNPQTGEGEIGEIIRYTQDQTQCVEAIQDRFSEIVRAKIPEVDRRLVFLNIMVASAPLLGLLGTVLGMLTTFQGISAGGSKTIDLIASGISEALITTEMGLLVALPGYFLVYLIRARRDEYEAFLLRLESFTMLQFGKDQEFPEDLDPDNQPTPSGEPGEDFMGDMVPAGA